jgi:hypothetical protein
VERKKEMTDRDSDWDWYYYEYRYDPYYSSGNRQGYNQDYGRNYGRDYERDYYNRNYGNRGYSNRNYYDRDYYNRNYGQNYGRGYGNNYYDRDYDYDNDYYGQGYGNYNWNRGRYSGVGPSGYQRSDERISEDINDRLTWHGNLDATDIQVDVNDGVATLTGSVHSRYEKRTAEDVAESVWGVNDVQNNLKIDKNNNQMQNQGSTSNQQEKMESSKQKR